jgi:deoxyribonuclease V
MIACVDVDYRGDEAVAACVLFRSWTDGESAGERVERMAGVQPYQPGEFYRRELPCLLGVLAKVADPLEAVVVDGYVWLGENRPGLGSHLFAALGKTLPVIGVAKNWFAGAETAIPVLRGGSQRPLFVTAAGLDPQIAAANIRDMHGPFRIPTLLKKVDQLCRGSG